MNWQECVNTAVSGVTNIVGNLTSSPNDQKKAVSAAKKAGKEAQKQAEKLYPSWDVKGTKDLAEKEGITSRAEWKRARAQAGQEAYQEAYDRVFEIYERAKNAEINNMEFQSSQEYLDHELAMAQTNAGAMSSALALEAKSASSGGGLGCCTIIIGVCSFGGGLVYLISNLI